MMDVAFGWAIRMPPATHLHSVKVKVQLDNLLSRQVQVLNSVTASGNTFNVLPTFNYFVTLSTEF